MRALQTDTVFRVLDGHDFQFDGDACRVEVYGVYDEGNQRWVQLALDGDRRQMVTLRLDVDPKPQCALVSRAVRQLENLRAGELMN